MESRKQSITYAFPKKEDIVDLPHILQYGCIVSNKVCIDGMRIRYMKHYQPTSHVPDSGWVVLSGFENDAYMDNIENHTIFSLNTVVNHDPSILKILEKPVGTAWERSATDDIFYQVQK